jgi:hypothetical protein
MISANICFFYRRGFEGIWKKEKERKIPIYLQWKFDGSLNLLATRVAKQFIDDLAHTHSKHGDNLYNELSTLNS